MLRRGSIPVKQSQSGVAEGTSHEPVENRGV